MPLPSEQLYHPVRICDSCYKKNSPDACYEKHDGDDDGAVTPDEIDARVGDDPEPVDVEPTCD